MRHAVKGRRASRRIAVTPGVLMPVVGAAICVGALAPSTSASPQAAGSPEAVVAVVSASAVAPSAAADVAVSPPVVLVGVTEELLDVAVPEAATIQQAIPTGDGISASSTPAWAFVLALLGMIGAGFAGLRLLGPRE